MRNLLMMAAAGSAALLFGATALPAEAAPVKNIVLVHGAWADGSGFRGVYDILTKDGYHVSIVANPDTGIPDDVAATQRVLDLQDGPVILVGHSYGGTVITEAGVDPKVVGLVYLAAFGPDAGEIVQGFAVAMRAGATKAMFDRTRDWADIEAMVEAKALDFEVVSERIRRLDGDDSLRAGRLLALRG